jgi:putative nucleotidyltransferase with HDIG domain
MLTTPFAAAAAICLTVIGARRGDTRTMLVGTAFAVMATLLVLHGLTTPGVVFGTNGVVDITGGANLPVGALILAVSILPLPRAMTNVWPLLVLDAALIALITAFGVTALAWPEIFPAVPAPGSTAAVALIAIGVAAFGLLAMRAFRTYRLTRRRLDLAVVLGLLWLGIAIVPMLTTGLNELGWWIAHEIEVNGILLIGICVAVDLAQSAQSRPLAGDFSGADLVASEDVFLGSHVRALTVTLADKDEYTERHTRRVALLAVQVGEELGLSPERLRTLAIGGLVHDIGKLSIPDEILKKPGALNDDEYSTVKEHAERGYKLLGELGGFSEEVRGLVRDHHERLDGRGYPRGLSADELTLDTRILTVCDVYDALRSKRVYRAAWTHDEAMEFLRYEDGAAFDQRCVGALARAVELDHARRASGVRVLAPNPAF